MPLQKIEGEIDREEYRCAFAMRIAGTAQTVRIVVSEEAAAVLAPAQTDNASCAELEPELSRLAALANEKFMCGAPWSIEKMSAPRPYAGLGQRSCRAT